MAGSQPQHRRLLGADQCCRDRHDLYPSTDPCRAADVVGGVRDLLHRAAVRAQARLCETEAGENRFGGTSILYDGTSTGRKWGTLETYGGKLTENIVQAIARDLLVYGMRQVARAGHRIVMHVHDEIVVETTTASVDEICALMATVPDWAEGLLLAADGYECEFYRKD